MTARPAAVPVAFGVILVGLGIFVAFRPLFTHNATITGQRGIDVMFAFYFLVSGSLRIRRAVAKARART